MRANLFPAVLLAGGSARRMGGGDKPLIAVQGRPILDWIIARVQPQVTAIAISANGDSSRFAGYSFDIVPDHSPELGPMAGILAGMVWAERLQPKATHLLTVSGDTPFLPSDLVERLAAALPDQAISMATAKSGGRLHPALSLWPIAARSKIQTLLDEGRGKRVMEWTDQLNAVPVEWPVEPYDPFFNVNTPDDLSEAEKMRI